MKRKIQPVTTVSTKRAAFGGFDFPTSEALHEGCLVQSLREIQFNGTLLASGSLLISLLQHGLIETDQKAFSENDATALLREPTCVLLLATMPMRIQYPIEDSIKLFIKAGMLRLIKL
ncbi:hypothetical protein [Bartonella taylorii]|uniref:Uncharacterized protein n=1 Tax=Bartonella taylorii 8TBB TaxID=1094560 RepID=A0A9P2RYE9_BARTA|nr:hypothetical protein [Bartonella taylorii]EJF92349.1 hypothetical protein ME9_01557 [Bartonella taylorii 8TBB]